MEDQKDGFKSRLQIARHLFYNGLRGNDLISEYQRILALPENMNLAFSEHPVKDQQQLYQVISATGICDGTREFTHLFMSMSGLPLTEGRK